MSFAAKSIIDELLSTYYANMKNMNNIYILVHLLIDTISVFILVIQNGKCNTDDNFYLKYTSV